MHFEDLKELLKKPILKVKLSVDSQKTTNVFHRKLQISCQKTMQQLVGWSCSVAYLQRCQKVKKIGSASSKGWSKSAPLIEIGLTVFTKLSGMDSCEKRIL